MSDHGLPILFALFVWWFSTGAVIYLDGLPQRTFKWSMLGASFVALLALGLLVQGSSDATRSGAYLAFTCGLLIWGWHEMSFLMGFLTGPRRTACPQDCGGVRHFVHGIETLLFHELAIIATAVLLWALTSDQPNQVAFWTFAILMGMRQSAKLNVFLGVRNLNAEFLPPHLEYLKSFLKTRPMNLLFPVSITASTAITTILVLRAADSAAGSFDAVAYTFLAILMALAVLEHWFLVLPLPAEKLWTWGLASRPTDQGPPPDAATLAHQAASQNKLHAGTR